MFSSRSKSRECRGISSIDAESADVDELLQSNSTPEYVSNPVVVGDALRSRVSPSKKQHQRRRQQNNGRRENFFALALRRRRSKRVVPQADRPETHFPRLFLTSSFGSVCKAALFAPPAALLCQIVAFFGVGASSSKKKPFAAVFAARRELAFAHVAAFNKACLAAARDLAVVVSETGVDELLEANCVVPVLLTYRASLRALLVVLATATTLVARHGERKDETLDSEDQNVLLLCVAIAFIAVALAVEPLVAAVEVVYLAYAQIPGGLRRANEILFYALRRRLVACLGRHDQLHYGILMQDTRKQPSPAAAASRQSSVSTSKASSDSSSDSSSARQGDQRGQVSNGTSAATGGTDVNDHVDDRLLASETAEEISL
ncbi:hypothetical protein CTAYLR_001950 [Chrysophaeum taylorii]|uniref:Uncharacterized protein n=1 Tax=Chrysophaeum taylorii TaxID=2483200 RepID=A0AAD7XI34_9STRA|nr:hypothetical protein CTAYLR_001950 [Chrysophaeum taylorii]